MRHRPLGVVHTDRDPAKCACNRHTFGLGRVHDAPDPARCCCNRAVS